MRGHGSLLRAFLGAAAILCGTGVVAFAEDATTPEAIGELGAPLDLGTDPDAFRALGPEDLDGLLVDPNTLMGVDPAELTRSALSGTTSAVSAAGGGINSSVATAGVPAIGGLIPAKATTRSSSF